MTEKPSVKDMIRAGTWWKIKNHLDKTLLGKEKEYGTEHKWEKGS